MMNIHDATETAYRNGYEQGKKDAVKHGEWCGTVCSACGASTANGFDYEYCPHCGAKMDG